MKKIKWGTLIISLAVPLGVGALAGLLTSSSQETFMALEKPPLAPPPVVFPIVWSVLYILMGISLYLVLTSDADRNSKTGAVTLFAMQLIVNFFWPIFFFNQGKYLFSLVWLLLLLVLVVLMIVNFRKIQPAAAALQLPYVLWLLFATYLNFGIWLLNR